VYSNKVVIYNDGQLPENWTVQKLLKKHPSAPYNPLLSRVFFLYGLIEAWGRGIFKMINECKNFGVAAPNFNTDFGGFFIEFFAKSDTNDDTNSDTNGDTNSDTNGDTNSDTNTMKLILALIKEKPTITVVALARRVKRARITILRHIEKLKEAKLLVRVGNNKLGYWRITKKGKTI
jgi:ATP-dependent DNA helicase RecG